VSVRFFDSSRPLVFAHRGGCAIGPENTMAAFDAGLAAGADGLELDVHLSADGVVVVHHDRTLERTTNDSGPVTLRTAAELARIDAAYHFCVDGAFPLRGQDVGVPTLADVLQRYRDTRVVIEMKMDVPELGESVVRTVRREDAVERVCVAGFGARAVEAARLVAPEIASSAHFEEVRLALYRSWVCWPVRRVRYQGYQIPEIAGRLRVVSPRFVRNAHTAGLKVQVWTVDTEVDMRRLLGWGADGLISNCPHIAVTIRDEWVQSVNARDAHAANPA
jgi:glycerophosphoryl diester phosphodiesterase